MSSEKHFGGGQAAPPDLQPHGGGGGGFQYPDAGPANYGQPPPYNASPPQYGQQPSAAAPPPPRVTVHVTAGYGPDPVQITCPSCRASIRSSVKSDPGPAAWIAGIGLCVFGCFLGCCLIPCCIDSMKVYTHTCPNCHVLLGKYKGSASLG